MAQDFTGQPYALLLLPTPPSPAFQCLKETYGPALSHVLSTLSKVLDGANQIAQLDVAVAAPRLLTPEYRPRASLFPSLQRLLASLYTLIGTTCAVQGVELDMPGGLDVRVFFVEYDFTQGPEKDDVRGDFLVQGPIINMPTLARSQRAWNDIYTLDNQAGRQLAAAFSRCFSSQAKDHRLPNTQMAPSGDASVPSEDIVVPTRNSLTPHSSVIVAGTFDHLHIGHKLLLTATALAIEPPPSNAGPDQGRLITVGVSGDRLLVNKKYTEFLESWDERWQAAASFLSAIIDFSPQTDRLPEIQRASTPEPNGTWVLLKAMPDLNIKLVQISDPFGPTITDKGITALVVSKETRSGGRAVNVERAKIGFPDLEIFEVDILQARLVEMAADLSPELFKDKISSTETRRRRMEMARGAG